MTHENKPKKAKMRHAEYYDQQAVQDELYRRSKEGEVFGHLMEYITSQENIKLAYRNIKRNGGSHTPGIDAQNIELYANMSEEDYVETISKKFTYYKPKAVKRVEIPKPNGGLRPLGIPCIEDRIIQQCILQIMEPICEAKFNDHSYGFRPCRSAENAVAEACRYAQLCHLHYVVDIDIKGFFDNVNHRKLMRQLWTMGIRDTKLLQILKAILKAPIQHPDGTREHPSKGTPQGGLLSPLLANVVLNELDWWIASQWELQCDHMSNPPPMRFNKSGSRMLTNEYRELRKTKLKEMHMVRYADDFKIFCPDRKTALAVFGATEKWLKERLHLDISPTKSKVTNMRRSYSEFLGFKLKVRKKGKKRTICAHMSDKAVQSVTNTLCEAVKDIQRSRDNYDLYSKIGRYNSAVMGIQNYYQIANRAGTDLGRIAWRINSLMIHRLHGLQKQGKISNPYIKRRYGKSKQLRYLDGHPLLPVGYIQTRYPRCRRCGINPYTSEGRRRIHHNLEIDTSCMRKLMRNPVRDRSVEYNDNRISLYAAQYGKCAVTQEIMQYDDIHCHHKLPKALGGSDAYQNLVLVKADVHKLIHATKQDTIAYYMERINPDTKQLDKVNKLRIEAKLTPIEV